MVIVLKVDSNIFFCLPLVVEVIYLSMDYIFSAFLDVFLCVGRKSLKSQT